ncbi:MAG: anti-sigma F factor [Clostridia bacterium]|jgi:stage II sporulation protein AB (anti-sigma F factor)|nr:anti-sigma F factor [Clostridia bacterium]MBR3037719.1 anti-sigma F factor [Clostridia bacterium]MBR3130569.1 anti-sigma F factor [Clostridia bacterium]
MYNEMEIRFLSLSGNEGFARAVASAFASQMNPSIEALSDIRTAVSEAVTNAIIHGYEQRDDRLVCMQMTIDNDLLTVTVRDDGCGIDDIELARKPFYTSKPELERSGMGFSVMEAFMDTVSIVSEPHKGTTITMQKRIRHGT